MATGHTVSQNSVYPRLLLRTLGPLELFVHPEGEEEHLVPAAGKALALLAYLACAPTRSAYRERLTELGCCCACSRSDCAGTARSATCAARRRWGMRSRPTNP